MVNSSKNRTKVYFIRHAEKAGDTGQSPLTKKGVKQAKYLAKRMKGKKFEEFYCSDFHRAKQTASAISKKIKMKPKIVPALNEFEMELLKTPLKKWPKKDLQHYNRLMDFLKKVTKNPQKEKRILIVCHGVTNRVILSYFLKLDLKTTAPFTQKETGINKVYWVEKFKNWRLICWNDSYHLPKRLR